MQPSCRFNAQSQRKILTGLPKSSKIIFLCERQRLSENYPMFVIYTLPKNVGNLKGQEGVQSHRDSLRSRASQRG